MKQNNNTSNSFDQTYWNNRWENKETGWDIGHASLPLTQFALNTIEKKQSILIPGCGNAYEAGVLLENKYENVTLLDIAPVAVQSVSNRFSNAEGISILCEDFFEHVGQYDFILEQTFLSALPKEMREEYALKMSQLLKPGGVLAGVLFSKEFHNSYPPFGGSIEEYEKLFTPLFIIEILEPCNNSIAPRAGNEVFIKLKKK